MSGSRPTFRRPSRCFVQRGVRSHQQCPQNHKQRGRYLPVRHRPFPLRPQSKINDQIDRFIPRAQVDARYLDTPYYVIPRDQVGKEAFAVIRDATRSKDVVGMGRVVLARRKRPIIVEPMGNGIRGITLRRSRMSGTKPPTCQHSKCVT